MSDNRLLISIIMPVYNSEKYICDTILSITKQTYQNIEIICVDDGSTDDSLQKLNTLSKTDERIRVVSIKNAGVSKARNVGLVNAIGEYIMFVDSDDWIDNNTCEIALNTLVENNADVVFWSYISEYGDHSNYKKLYDEDKIIFERKDGYFDLHRRMVGIVGPELRHPEYKDSLCSACMKLYKSSVIKESNAEFTDLSQIGTYEDGLFNIYVFGKVNKAVYIGNYLYHYRRTNNDSVTSKHNQNLFVQWHRLYEIIKEYLIDNGLFERYKEAYYNKVALDILGIGFNCFAPGKNAFAVIRDIKKKLKDSVYHAALQKLKIQYMPIHWKVFFVCAKCKFAFMFYLLMLAIKKLK